MLSEAQIYSLVKKSLNYNDPASKICTTFCLTDKKNKKITTIIESDKEQYICGISLAQNICHLFFKDCSFTQLIQEGVFAKKKQTILSLNGPLSSLLDCKETILYYLSRMTAITDLVHKYQNEINMINPSINLIEGHFWNPDMVILEKYACATGGVKSYKRFFQKTVIINENHLLSGEKITDLVNKLEERLSPTTKIQVHPRTLEQVKEAASIGVDLIVLKGFSKSHLKMALHIIQGKCLVEIAGDISIEQLQEICLLPINFISSDLIIKNSGFAPFSLCL